MASVFIRMQLSLGHYLYGLQLQSNAPAITLKKRTWQSRFHRKRGRARVLVSRERRELLLEEYDRSGMSAVKFAEYIGIKYSTLAYWLQSRRERRQ